MWGLMSRQRGSPSSKQEKAIEVMDPTQNDDDGYDDNAEAIVAQGDHLAHRTYNAAKAESCATEALTSTSDSREEGLFPVRRPPTRSRGRGFDSLRGNPVLETSSAR